MRFCPAHVATSRGLFHPVLPMPSPPRARRYTGRWWQVGMRFRSRSQARQMRHLLFRSAVAFLFASLRLNPLVIIIGVNGESSFESSLLKRAPGCEIWGYDYSVENVRVSCPFFNQEPLLTCSFHQWGPEIRDDSELRDRAHFQPWALGGADDHGEHSNPKYWTLDSLMRHNGTLRSISPPTFHFISTTSLICRLPYQITALSTSLKLTRKAPSLMRSRHSSTSMPMVTYPSANFNSRSTRRATAVAPNTSSNGGSPSKQPAYDPSRLSQTCCTSRGGSVQSRR